MRTIRRKINFVVVMLVAAGVVSAAIYLRGGFSIGGSGDVGYCGTVDPHLSVTNDAAVVNGERLFKANCTSCHSLDKKLLGPALRGMKDRVQYKNFIEDLLLNPKRTLKYSTYAKQLSKEYGDNGHMDFSGIVSRSELEDIIKYTKCYIPKAAEQVGQILAMARVTL